MVLFNLTKPIDEAKLFYWLHSIQSRAPGQPVMIVGTHADNLDSSKLDDLSRCVSEVIETWKSSFPSSVQGLNILQRREKPTKTGNNCNLCKSFLWLFSPVGRSQELEASLGEIATSFSPHVPSRYFSQLEKIIELRKYCNRNHSSQIIKWSIFEELAKSVNLDEDSLRYATKALHQWGEILHFDTDYRLKDFVIIDPHWLSDVMKTLVTFVHSGKIVVTRSELEGKWQSCKFPKAVFPFLFTLLESTFGIIARIDTFSLKDLAPESSSSTSQLPSESLCTDAKYVICYFSPKKKPERVWPPSHHSVNFSSTTHHNMGAPGRDIGTSSAKSSQSDRLNDTLSIGEVHIRHIYLPFSPPGFHGRILNSIHKSSELDSFSLQILNFWKTGSIIQLLPLSPSSFLSCSSSSSSSSSSS